MSAFWDTLADANAVSLEALGETITLDGAEITGIVTGAVTVEDGSIPGGQAALVTGEILVPATITPRTGMKATVRGLPARVDTWECHGAGGWLLRLGPANRAAGGW